MIFTLLHKIMRPIRYDTLCVSTPFLVFVYVYDLFIFFLQLFYLCRSLTSVYPFSAGEVGNIHGFLNDQTGACVFLYSIYLLIYECAYAYACLYAHADLT